jgi:hypothetical protein
VSKIALTSAPLACAAKGEIKCLGLNKGIAAANPSGVLKLAPTGGGINIKPNCKTNELEMAPTRIDAIQIPMCFTIFMRKKFKNQN